MEATQDQLMACAAKHFNRSAIHIAQGARALELAGNEKAIPALKQFIGEMVILAISADEIAKATQSPDNTTETNNESPEDQPDDQ